MPLRALLYRCPRCGEDPVEGKGSEVRCPACGRTYRRAGAGGRIRVTEAGGKPQEVLASRLHEAIDAMEGPLPAARREDGRVEYEASVIVRRGEEEVACRHGRELLGYHETLGAPEPGVLRATDEGLELVDDGTTRARWNFLDVRSVLASSSAVQIRSAAGELVHFRFSDDSPFRWQQLLHLLLRKAYREAGRGEIAQFKPRIVTR